MFSYSITRHIPLHCKATYKLRPDGQSGPEYLLVQNHLQFVIIIPDNLKWSYRAGGTVLCAWPYKAGHTVPCTWPYKAGHTVPCAWPYKAGRTVPCAWP